MTFVEAAKFLFGRTRDTDLVITQDGISVGRIETYLVLSQDRYWIAYRPDGTSVQGLNSDEEEAEEDRLQALVETHEGSDDVREATGEETRAIGMLMSDSRPL